jgi:hypothetical protein
MSTEQMQWHDASVTMPEPLDYCYEWDGPYGTRKFSAAPHNGMKPTRSVPLFSAEQMHDYAGACVLAATTECSGHWRVRLQELEAAEEGAKEAFGVVVQEKHDALAECQRLHTLLGAAYADLRRRPPLNDAQALELARKHLDKGLSWAPRITRCTDAEIKALIRAVEAAHGIGA